MFLFATVFNDCSSVGIYILNNFVVHTVDQEEKDGVSVGQSMRIRVGPLKGYMCRVMAIRYSDITVKLDSQHKILTGSSVIN